MSFDADAEIQKERWLLRGMGVNVDPCVLHLHHFLSLVEEKRRSEVRGTGRKEKLHCPRVVDRLLLIETVWALLLVDHVCALLLRVVFLIDGCLRPRLRWGELSLLHVLWVHLLAADRAGWLRGCRHRMHWNPLCSRRRVYVVATVRHLRGFRTRWHERWMMGVGGGGWVEAVVLRGLVETASKAVGEHTLWPTPLHPGTCIRRRLTNL